MIARCYDGSSTMSGHLGGLQALMMQEICPIAILSIVVLTGLIQSY